jgi:hypothetical protein
MIYKNWPKDAQVGCHFTKKDVGEFFLLLKQTFLKPTKKNWTNLAPLRMICNCCSIFFTNMDFILTCLRNLHFEF